MRGKTLGGLRAAARIPCVLASAALAGCAGSSVVDWQLVHSDLDDRSLRANPEFLATVRGGRS